MSTRTRAKAKPALIRDGCLTIHPQQRGKVRLAWDIDPAGDAILAPPVVMRIMTHNLLDQLLDGRGINIHIVTERLGSIRVPVEHANDAEMLLRRWLRRIIGWPGAGMHNTMPGYRLPKFAEQMPAEGGSPGPALSHIEQRVDELRRHDDALYFTAVELADARYEAAMETLAERYGHAADLYRFVRSEDMMAKITKGQRGAGAQVPGD
jgi:hypothetical protein